MCVEAMQHEVEPHWEPALLRRSGSRTVVVVMVNTNTESMRVSTDMEYVDAVASKKWFLRGVALTLPQVR